jgi:hypothetical protein
MAQLKHMNKTEQEAVSIQTPIHVKVYSQSSKHVWINKF